MTATVTIMTTIGTRPVCIAQTFTADEAAELLAGHPMTSAAARLEGRELAGKLDRTFAGLKALNRARRFDDDAAFVNITIGVGAGNSVNLTLQAEF